MHMRPLTSYQQQNETCEYMLISNSFRQAALIETDGQQEFFTFCDDPEILSGEPSSIIRCDPESR